MRENTDIVSVLIRQRLKRSEFLRPLQSIAEIAWRILLQVYASAPNTGCSIDSLVTSLEMERREMTRYISVLCRYDYIAEEYSTLWLTEARRIEMDAVLAHMTQDMLSSLNA